MNYTIYTSHPPRPEERWTNVTELPPLSEPCNEFADPMEILMRKQELERLELLNRIEH